MPLHPQVITNLNALARQALPSLRTLPPAQARVAAAQRRAAASLHKEPVASVVEQSIPGPAGDIPVRIYRPSEAVVHPLVMVFHGGGWVFGSPESEDTTSRGLANRATAVVVSVDYRLAPESPYPGAAEDCYAATLWAVEHAGELGIDSSRVAVAGTSAGGNLSAAVCLMARDRDGPVISHQVLFNPVIDSAMDTPSYEDNATGCGMTRADMEWFWNHYVPDVAQRKEAYASPIRATSLAGLPPATIITAEYDVLRDEAEHYARRLTEAGVDTQCTRYDGMVHGFNNQLGLYDDAQTALDEAGLRLRHCFAS
jgi:acetyl esterase